MATNTGKEFEALVQQLLKLAGYVIEPNEIITGTQIDILARRSDTFAQVLYLVECTDGAEPVAIDYVKEKASVLLDADTNDHIVCLMIVSRAGFTAPARDFALNRPRLILRTLAELESSIVDFSPYKDWYTFNYRSSTNIFSDARLYDHYVDTSVVCDGQPTQPLESAVRNWLNQPDNNVLFLLGDYGAGKTSFLRHFTFELLSENGREALQQRVPILIPLREYRTAINLRQVITDTLINEYGVPLTSFQAFERFCSLGHAVVLLDGFDEMAANSTPSTLLDCLGQIFILAETNTKLIVTCRSNFFRSHYQLFDLLRRFAIELPSPGDSDKTDSFPLGKHGTVMTLCPLSATQVRNFIARRFPGTVDSLIEKISSFMTFLISVGGLCCSTWC